MQRPVLRRSPGPARWRYHRSAMGRWTAAGLGLCVLLGGCSVERSGLLVQRRGDAGAVDGGMRTDAGRGGPDAGRGSDAGGTLDAGSDAGATLDAGSDAGGTLDAGSDAGGTLDAGSDAGIAPGSCTGGVGTLCTCPVGMTCDLVCLAPPCDFVCVTGSACTATCGTHPGDDACTFMCATGATCTFACHNRCTVTCATGSSCTVDCHDACGLTCLTGTAKCCLQSCHNGCTGPACP